MFTLPLNRIYDEVVLCISSGLVPLVTSSPGVGKSSIMAKVAKDYRLKLIDVRLSQCTPEDLNGFPMREGDKASFKPFDIFPLNTDEVPEGYDGWLLFLDEMTSASKPVQAAAYKVVLDKMVGSHRLHPQVAIAGAGNKITDKAIVNQMSTALQSRVVHFEAEVSAKQWDEYAVKAGIDHRVRGFMSYQPSKLMDFRPDHQDKTFPCPRTWEFVSRLVKNREIDESAGPRIAGCVGEGAAVEFITFAQEYDRLPKLADIIAEPKTTPVPPVSSTKYATMSMLVENFDEKTLDPILDYVRRFPTEIQIIFCRGAVTRSPETRSSHKKFGEYLIEMVRYLQ